MPVSGEPSYRDLEAEVVVLRLVLGNLLAAVEAYADADPGDTDGVPVKAGALTAIARTARAVLAEDQ
jgi:hypothetical protein